MGLIGKEMFAIDGCKMSSNASKEWSGTKKELRHKKEKMEKAIKAMIAQHKERDKAETDKAVIEKEEQYLSTLKAKIKKIKDWLDENDDKPANIRCKPRKSNITDNERHDRNLSGVVQGYNGVAMVDSKHQVVVHADATGDSGTAILKPMVEGTRRTSRQSEREDIFKRASWQVTPASTQKRTWRCSSKAASTHTSRTTSFVTATPDTRLPTGTRSGSTKKSPNDSTERSSSSQEISRSARTRASASARPASECTKAAMRSIMDYTPSSTTGPREIVSPASSGRSV
jgi:hypothetical protein